MKGTIKDMRRSEKRGVGGQKKVDRNFKKGVIGKWEAKKYDFVVKILEGLNFKIDGTLYTPGY